jgi:hypothetical protein
MGPRQKAAYIFTAFLRKIRTRHLMALALICSPLLSWAQAGSTRCRSIPQGRLQFQLDSLSANPESIKLPHDIAYSYDLATGELTFERPLEESIEVCYQVLPFALHEPIYKYDMSLYSPEGPRENVPESSQAGANTPLVKEELFATESLYKSGSISRGITVGNTNNLGVISSLNLQLDGQLADDLFINAVITDQQVPFQPEGNTQQIQDFDKVLVNLYNDKFSLMAGDVVLRNDSTYFLKYYKNVQGGRAAYKYDLGSWKASTSVTASIAKGKFSSTLLEAVEGLSGPYRLRGPDGERFIIVIANSEKIYLDGRLLKRGFNEDYVIDYNLAEITFTPKVLITKFSRIRVDFEYTSQNFSRSILSASHRQSNGKTTAYFEVYREKDNPFRPLAYDLTEADRLALSGIGDDLSLAAISGADSVGYSDNRILYARVDTVDAQGRAYSIYQYSSNPETAVYQVSFSQVSAGDYVQLPLGLNGKVYEWVAPVNGVSQGDYSPSIPVVTPNSRQLVVGGVSSKITPYETVYTELSASNQDKNLFSTFDQQDNQGWAQKSGIRSEGREVGFLKDYQWLSEASYEWNHQYFRPIDRYRYIEYDRDWSYTPIFQSAQEPAAIEDHIVVGRLGMQKSSVNRWNYQASYRNKGQVIDGWQQKALLRQQLGKATFSGDFFDLKSAQSVNESTWTRAQLTAAYKLGKLMPGYIFQSDRNAITNQPTDSVASSAMNYSQHMVFLQSADTAQNGTTFRLDANRRIDDRPVDGVLEQSDISYTSNASFTTQWKDRHVVSGVFTYRQLDDILDTSDEKEETVQGRINWQSAWWERSIRSDLSLALLNGRELRREYVFIEVIPGQGTHTWRDDNGDGVQDLNEFYEAINPDERTYAKIFVPTDSYISAYQTILNYSLELTAPAEWKSAGGFKSFLGRFSNVSAVLVDRKTQDSNWAQRFDVWSTPGTSEDELAYKNAIRSRWFFNRADPKYGLDVGYQSTAGRQLLTGGWEARNKKVWQLNTRTNLSADWAVFLQSEVGETESSSDIFSNRNYRIRQRQVKPQLQWMPLQWLRITSSIRYSHKRALPVSEEQGSDLTEYQIDWQMNKSLQSTISGFVKVINMNFEGDEASPLGYEMLEALRPGTNYTWRLQWQQRLKSGLRLQINYDGRKSPSKAVIHFGGVQVTALF